MTTEIKLWKIKQDNKLDVVKSSKLNLEARLEEWLEKDIALVSDGILIIGRQVGTIYGGTIDLLGMDRNGDLILLELKRDKTPREITAQILDYASWIKDLSNEIVSNIANNYLGQRNGLTLEDAFQKKFGIELPEVINESHSMLIIASQIDPASERIIKYLSETYGVNINAATFQHFEDDGGAEILGRAFLIQPSEGSSEGASPGPKRRTRPKNLSLEELSRMAEARGLGEFYKNLTSALEKEFVKTPNRSSLAFYGSIGDGRKSIFSLIPTQSSKEEGLKFQVYITRFIKYFDISREILLSMLPENKEDWKYYPDADVDYSGCIGYFQTEDEVNKFITWLSTLRERIAQDSS